MKRVGISNFLRFFLYNKKIVSNYIADGNSHLFIRVDLNDLVEREVFPFWILTLKRIYDSVEASIVKKTTKEYVEKLFLDSMQSKDTFLTIESVKKSLTKITDEKILPTIFFIRFFDFNQKLCPKVFQFCLIQLGRSSASRKGFKCSSSLMLRNPLTHSRLATANQL